MSGQNGSKKGAPRGRPKKKPGYSRDNQIQELISKATELYKVPYDDRDGRRSPDDPTIEAVAREMNISPVKVRNLLITADYYTTAMSREVQALRNKGCTINEISEKTGLKKSVIYGYLPYSRGAYKLNDPTVQAEQNRNFRRRKKSCDDLAENKDGCDASEYLWEAILAFENYPFLIDENRCVKYQVNEDCICFDGETISKEEIENRFKNLRKQIASGNLVCEEDAIKCCCSRKLYAVFLRIGACMKN